MTVEAAYSKRRRRDVLPLKPDLAVLLGDYLKGRPAGSPVWPGTWVERAARMVRENLAGAGIPYKDASGRFFDFHALRHQFISKLAMSGVSVKATQTLARHSTVTLTMDRYAHAGLKDTAEALERLPGRPGNAAGVKGADQGTSPAEKLVPGLYLRATFLVPDCPPMATASRRTRSMGVVVNPCRFLSLAVNVSR